MSKKNFVPKYRCHIHSADVMCYAPTKEGEACPLATLYLRLRARKRRIMFNRGDKEYEKVLELVYI